MTRLLLQHLSPSLGDPRQVPQSTGCWNELEFADGGWLVRGVNLRAQRIEL